MVSSHLLPTPWTGTARRAVLVAVLALAVLQLAPGAAADAPAPSPAPVARPLDAASFLATLRAHGIRPEGRPSARQLAGMTAVLRVFPPEERRDALQVAWCESRLDPGAVGPANRNGSRDFGLFQFNDGGTLQHYIGSEARAMDAVTSARAARTYAGERGWRPWTCGELVGAVRA